MRILFVVSGNSKHYKISPFIVEQVAALQNKGVAIDFFSIEGKGVWGYSKNIFRYFNKIKQYKPDIIHAHYGLSGLFANLQRKIPVVTTFHGSDINEKAIRPFSIIASRLSAYSIFVSKDIAKKVLIKSKFSIIPCAIDLTVFYPLDKKQSRVQMGFTENENLILFSSSFSIPVKNCFLAKQAIHLLEEAVNLIELEGYTREQVNVLLNACDVALLTSLNEGSPQFIKEAMACNRPIVGTDVGDVRTVINNAEGCYITSHQPDEVAEAIRKVFRFNKPTRGREYIKHLDSEIIAGEIIDIYTQVLSHNLNNQ